MRNLTKFLALVLAMLMVSACAFSVSAKVFNDQDAVDATGYDHAITTLSDLGVIVGDENGNFNPNETLTRDVAAVILAKMHAGNKKIDWTASKTCVYSDVTAEWSFGYINYCAENGLMTGVGDGKFNPKGTLTYAEAITMVCKALGYTEAVNKLAALDTFTLWYAPWVMYANTMGITDTLTINTYADPCPKYAMAELADVMLNRGYASKFGLTKLTAYVEGVEEGLVYTGETMPQDFVVNHIYDNKFNRTAFEECLAKSGFKGTAADLKGARIELIVNDKENRIYGITVLSDVTVYDYRDAKISAPKNSDGAYDGTFTIDGKSYTYDAQKAGTYTVGTSQGFGKDGDKTYYIDVASFGYDNKPNQNIFDIPTYYKAYAFDDNGDGMYDRMMIEEYWITEITKNSDTSITAFGTTLDKDTAGAIVLPEGAEFTADGEVPVLAREYYCVSTKKVNIDVFEVAATQSGVLNAISTAKPSITLDTTVYAIATGNAAYTISYNKSRYINQSVVIYTINGAFVKYATAISNYTYLYLDKATVVDGKAVITGFDEGNKFTVKTMTIDGIYKHGKLVDMGAFMPDTVMLASQPTNSANINGLVYMAESDNLVFPYNVEVTFEEAHRYCIRTVGGKNYVYADDGFGEDGVPANFYDIDTLWEQDVASRPREEYSARAIALKNGYVYGTKYVFANKDAYLQNDTSKAESETKTIATYSSDLVIFEVVDNGNTKNCYDAITYKTLTTFPEAYKVEGAVHYASTDDMAKRKIDCIIITDYSKTTPLDTTYASVKEEGYDIVQILSDTYVIDKDTITYSAVRLTTGEVIEVKDVAGDDFEFEGYAKSGEFYVINSANVIVREDYVNVEGKSNKGAWLTEFTITASVQTDSDFGLIDKVIYKTNLVSTLTVTTTSEGKVSYTRNAEDGVEIDVTKDVIVYKTSGNVIKTASGAAETAAYALSGADDYDKLVNGEAKASYFGYVVGDTVIILDGYNVVK